MDISRMLSNGVQDTNEQPDTRRLHHQYPTRHAASAFDQGSFAKPYSPASQRYANGNGTAAAGSGYARSSPAKRDQKHIVFQLVDEEDPSIQARLPMRVMISRHDTTDSIITTVKNFYGLYEYGFSFEDKDGISIIATYDNFENDMTVYVRTIAQRSVAPSERARDSISPKKPSLGAPIELRPTSFSQAQSPNRSLARSVGVRSLSPQSDAGRRSASVAAGSRPRPHKTKSKDNTMYGDMEGYSSGDNGGGSVTSSRRSTKEVVNAEISVDNIVEGGRRKGAFESSVGTLHLASHRRALIPRSNYHSSYLLRCQSLLRYHRSHRSAALIYRVQSHRTPIPTSKHSHTPNHCHPPKAMAMVHKACSLAWLSTVMTVPSSRLAGSCEVVPMLWSTHQAAKPKAASCLRLILLLAVLSLTRMSLCSSCDSAILWRSLTDGRRLLPSTTL